MVVCYDSNLDRNPNESDMEYVQRMCSTKDVNKFSWKSLAEFLNNALGYTYSSSYYRRHFHNGDFARVDVGETTTTATAEYVYTYSDCSNACKGDCGNCDDLPICLETWREELDKTEARIDEKTLAMRKERTKLNDERAHNNRLVKQLAREETIQEIAHDFARTMSAKKRLPVPSVTQQFMNIKEEEGILLLSDWHYGMICDNPWNTFSPEICRDRVGSLLERVIHIVDERCLSKVTVMNLSDLIAGRIHTQIRIESRFDVITQIMEVSEILAEFLTDLSLHCKVSYYDCLDNHSRLEPNKNDSMDLESLVRIIPWYLKERLIGNDNVTIHENEFGADIITCQILGHDVIGVHGDHDSPVTGIDKLTLMTHRHYDLFCTAHRHHFYMDEKNHCMIVGNSSLMGTDSYAEKLRLSSDPSQTFIVATKDNVCDCIYKIKLV